MKTNLFLRLPIVLAVMALVLGLVTQAHAQAAGPVTLLDDAHATLAQAKHDYKGHRVKAMKQIELALGEKGAKVSGKGKVREPQSTSDAQLRAAQALLQEAVPQLSGKALKHVNAAVSQISTALQIR
jgi:hypothetical protein